MTGHETTPMKSEHSLTPALAIDGTHADGGRRASGSAGVPPAVFRVPRKTPGRPRQSHHLRISAGCCAGRAARQAGRPRYPRHAVLLIARFFARDGIFHFVLMLAFLAAAGFTADAPVLPPPAASAANVQIQIQGGGAVQIQGGGQIQFQLNGVRVQAAAGVVQGNTITPRIDPPPVIFFPGIPSILIPNPAALADAKPGFLGVQLDIAGDELADDAGEKKDPAKKIVGVGILNVVGDSPAEKAGLKDGDRVLTLEGKEAKNSVQLREMIRALKPEQGVKMTVRREGKEIEIKAKLTAAPEQAVAMQLQVPGADEPQAVPGVVVFNRTTFTARSAGGGTSANAPADKDTVTLRDGNRFVGKVRGFDPAKGLLLQREGLPGLELIEEEITGLTFAEREQSAAVPAVKNAAARPQVMLQLRDGSSFHGDALTMAHGTLVLTLPGGQRIEIPREHAQSALLSDGESAQIYDGPTGLTGWSSGRSNPGQWEYRDGLLRCLTNGPIGRGFGRMPEPLDLSFDVVFPRQMQHFGITLFSTNANEAGAGTLTMQFSPNQIYGSHFDGRRSNQYNTPLKPDGGVNFSDKPATIRYRLLVDRVNGRALIYSDGVQRADWKLSKVKPEDIGKSGAAFSITPHVSMAGATFAVGRVRLMPWSGKEPVGGAETLAPKGDQVLAGNGAATGGSLDRITDGEIIFTNPAANVRRQGTLYVRFAAPAAVKEFPAAAAMVRMKNGSEFAATMVRGSGEALTLTTPSGQEITLPLAALREMDFLPRAGQGEVSAKRPDVLTLTDGTQWKGRVLAPIAGDIVRWKIAASKAPLEYPSAKIAGIFFSNSEATPEAPALKGDNAVHLRNGDWLPGNVVSLDGGSLVVHTGLTPALNIPLGELRGIYLNPEAAATLGDGATGKFLWNEGWNPNRATLTRESPDTTAKTEQPWRYHDGGYTLTGTARMGQTILAHRWPEYAGAYAVNLDITNPGRSPSFSLQLFNAKDERTFTVSAGGGRVYVYFNPGTARLNRFAAGGKRFQVEEKIDPAGGITRIAIVLDRPAKTFRVFMGGKEVGKIPFKQEEANEALDACGMSLSPWYYSSAGGKQSRIARIWIAPWSGPSDSASGSAEKVEAPGRNAPDEANAPAEKKEPAAPEPKKDPAPAPEPGKDSAPTPTIYLANGDEFTGAIGKLTADLVTVESDAGPLELPGKRIAWIHFPGSTADSADHFPRLRFHDRGLLSVKDLQIGEERVKCNTLQGQPLDFPLGLLKEVVWRALDEK